MSSSTAAVPTARVLTPRDCAVSVVVFVPFLCGAQPSSAPPEGPAGGSPVPTTPHAGATPPVSGLDAFQGMLGDLRLWGYSEDVNRNLREFLPHRLRDRPVLLDDMPSLPPPGGAQWQPLGGVVQTWSADVGMAVLTYRLAETGTETWAELRDSVIGLDIRSGEGPRTVVLRRTAQMLAGGSGTEAGSCSPLWVQAYFAVTVEPGLPTDALDAPACELTGRGDKLEPLGDWPGEVLWLGSAACAVSTAGNRELADALGRVVATQSATWAAAIEMDRHLGGLLTSGGREARRCSLEALQDRSVQLLEEFERVQQFRAGIQLLPLHLGAPDKAVWRRVSEVWELEAQLTAMDTKLSAIEHVYNHLATAMSERQARFLNFVVLGVTCLSLATFVLTVWDFTQKNFDPFHWLSGGVSLTAGVLAGAFFVWVWRASTRKEMRVSRARGPGRTRG